MPKSKPQPNGKDIPDLNHALRPPAPPKPKPQPKKLPTDKHNPKK